MRKFLILSIGVLVVWAAAAYLYRGRVPADSIGTWVTYGAEGARAEIVQAQVFRYGEGELLMLPASSVQYRLDGDDAITARTRDGIEVTIAYQIGVQFSQDGAVRFASTYGRPVEELISSVFRTRISAHTAEVVAHMDLVDLLGPLDDLCGSVLRSARADVQQIGPDLLSLEALGPVQVEKEVQQAFHMAISTDRDLALAEKVFGTAILLEEASKARNRMLVDSTLSFDRIARTDSLRANELVVQRYKRDSSLFALKYTHGFLENKRLELVAKAVEKWNGQLSGSQFRTPFEDLGKIPETDQKAQRFP
ncbi:MAG TPA: SPFH domain-containing protein [Flavobacteriales bacterium]|jgi:hypothetical protein|nr:hypothetical protein [Flavobacteriales bacterium]MBK7483346.1 hypothetical protein [Flavobacteriales bacterium]MBK8530474.1 hypothetical protein [Flavobacteriales bacterium]MBP9178833.1 hypothetical protein [Flavobacteriales bacterium]HQW06138.1 SPFH domain-containing protein [Flavobacteriales bacterium]